MKKELIVALVGIGVFIAAFLAGKAYGKAKAKEALAEYDPDKLPTSGMGIPKGWAAEASRIVSELNQQLKGVTVANPLGKDKRDLVLSKLDYLTDDQFTMVNNIYNQAIGAKNKETLRKAIKSEWGISKEVLTPLMDRFNRLNIQ